MQHLLRNRFQIQEEETGFFDKPEKLIRRKTKKELREEYLSKKEAKQKKLDSNVFVPVSEYRKGGDGFVRWCEDNVNLAIYKENATVPTWTPMCEMPDAKNPDTGRSYKDMWEFQKPIIKKALAMENGRFLHRLIVFCWGRGDGKCLNLLTKILMYDGSIKYAKDVKKGDLLMGPDNTPRRVLQTVRGEEEMFEIVPNRGESFVVTGDHKLTLKRRTSVRNRNGVIKRDPGNGEIIDITVNDYKKQSDNFKRQHMLFRVPIDWPEQKVPIDPYFLGIWLGDGNSNAPSITTMDKEVVTYLKAYADKMGMKLTSHKQMTTREGEYTESKSKMYSFVGDEQEKHKNHILNLLRENMLIKNKHIPHVYKANSREIRMQILAGILDADGYRNRNSFELTIKREVLADDVAFIARSLGFHVCKTKVIKGIKSTGFSGEYFRLGISGDCSQIPIRVEHKKCEKRSDWKDVLVSNIKEIKSVGVEEYAGFRVDKDNRFLLGDFTVTHNSLVACLIQLWKFFCFPRQQIMLGANSKDQVKFVHYDIMKDIILNSPKLLSIIGKKNIQEKEMHLKDGKGRVISVVRSISSFSGIVSNITGYTFSEIFDMKNPKFFVQLDGSIRNMPNALGVIDSTVSEKSHILYKLYESSLDSQGDGHNLTFFSYRCSPEGSHEDFFNPQMTQKQLDDYKRKFPPAEFARYFKNLWDTGITNLFSPHALEAIRYFGVNGQMRIGSDYIQKMILENNERKKILEIAPDERRFTVDEDAIKNAEKSLYQSLSPMTELYRLDYSTYFCDMANSFDLEKLTEFFDTNWVIGCGVDRADPMKSRQDGARTMVAFIAKGLPGSRSKGSFASQDDIYKYVYIVLGVKHVIDSSLEEIKKEINLAEIEFSSIDTFCSERWGMFDIGPWLEEKGIETEILHPTPAKQKEAFSEIYAAVNSERFKCPTIGYPGSKNPDILFEEMSTIITTPGKDWYGSPEKNETNGIQDDTMYAVAWCIYGLRFKTVDDMQPRAGNLFFGEFVKNKNLIGEYK